MATKAPAALALTAPEAAFITRCVPQAVKSRLEATIPSESELTVSARLQISGQLVRGKSATRKPTSRALRKATLALLIRRLGIQREQALAVLSEILVEAHKLDQNAEEALLAEHPEVLDAFGRLDGFIDTLPAIQVQGAFHTRDIKIARLEDK